MVRIGRFRCWLGLVVVAMGIFALVMLFTDPRTRGLLANSLRLAVSTSAVILPLALLLATLLVKCDIPGRQITWGLVISSLFLPLYVVAAAWDSALGLQGWLTRWVSSEGATVPILTGWTGAIFVHSVALLPAATLLIGVGLASVERELEEDALLAIGPARVLYTVTWRRASGAILAAVVWVFIVCIGEMTVTDLFQIRTFAEEIYVQTAGGAVWNLSGLPGVPAASADSSHGSFFAGTLLIVLLLVPAVWVCLGLVDRWQRATRRVRWRIPLERGRWPIGLGVLGCMLILVGLPLCSLFYQAGVLTQQVDDIYVPSWSWIKGLTVVGRTPWIHGRELAHTLVVSGTAAVAATAAAGLLGLWAGVARTTPAAPKQPGYLTGLLGRWTGSGKGARLVATALAACLAAIPGPLIGLWLIRGLNQPPESPLAFLAVLYDEAAFGFAPWLAQTLRVLPFAIIVLVPAMASTPQVLLETAALDGAGLGRKVTQLLVPLHWRSMVLAWLVTFVLAVGELSATILVTPPGVTPLSVRIFNLVHYGVDDQLAGLVLFVWISVLILTACGFFLAARRRMSRVERG